MCSYKPNKTSRLSKFHILYVEFSAIICPWFALGLPWVALGMLFNGIEATLYLLASR